LRINRIIRLAKNTVYTIERGHPDIPMTFIPMTYIPMTKPSMCRYSYKKSVEISKHFNDNRFQQNNTPLLQQPMLLCVDISTDQSPYVSTLQQLNSSTCRYSYRKSRSIDSFSRQETSSDQHLFSPTQNLYTAHCYYVQNLQCVDTSTKSD
jgi:hypothetical protein